MDAGKMKQYRYLRELSKNEKYVDECGKIMNNAMPLLMDVFGMTLLEAKHTIKDYNFERNIIFRYMRQKMKEEITYVCTKCKREVKPVYDMTKDIFRVNDVDVEAMINILKCPYCGTEIWDKYNEVDNEAIIYNKYKKMIEEKK